MIDDKRKRTLKDRQARLAGAVVPLPQTPIKRRLIDSAGELAHQADEITYQHSILCQTSLPYRDPGMDVRRWSRRQGNAVLEIDAGRAIHPERGEFVDVPIPHGPKARLILMYLNAEAIRTQSARVDVGGSLTDFVKRIGMDPMGRNIRAIRGQVTALSTATIRLGFIHDRAHASQIQTQIVQGFELFLPKDNQQRVLWPSYVDLDLGYFASLQAHAVPLDERAIAALSHSAMALDLYAWLAQRLYRVAQGGQLVPWTAVKEQFGGGYQSLRKFRQVFMEALRQVHVVYPAARLDVTSEGLLLHASAAPISKKGVVVRLLNNA